MHGLILAGGIGSRLSADGIQEPKSLIRISGRPQLARLCDTLEALGCDGITCMVRDGVPAGLVVGDGGRRRAIYCSTPTSLHTLVLGFAAVPPGPVFCTMVDTVMHWDSWQAVWTAWTAASADGLSVALAVAPLSVRENEPLYVECDEAGWVTRIGAGADRSPWCTAGVYGFGSAVRPLAAAAIAEGVTRLRGWLTRLPLAGLPIRVVPIARALDVDHRDDLDEANRWAPAATP